MQASEYGLPSIPQLRGWVIRLSGFPSHGDDGFSSGVSFFQISDGLGDLGERVRPVDDRCELAGFDKLLEYDHILVVLLRDERDQLLAHDPGQQESADLAICASEPPSFTFASGDDEGSIGG